MTDPAATPDQADPRQAGPLEGAARAARPETPPPADGRASLDVARRVVELAEDKKAADIVLLDLGELTTLADAFVICSGGSERQLDAIADGIVSGLRRRASARSAARGSPRRTGSCSTSAG